MLALLGQVLGLEAVLRRSRWIGPKDAVGFEKAHDEGFADVVAGHCEGVSGQCQMA